jgi:sodium-dependent dicarboxylate transporter 2/3/5
VGTKIGTATNSIFLGFAADRLGTEISFLGYAAGALPFVLLFLPLTWWTLWRVARKDALAGTHGRDVLDRDLAGMGPLRGRERRVAGVFLAAAVLWIAADPLRGWLSPIAREFGFKLAGKHVEAGIAMSAALALALLGTLSIAALRKVPWDTLLLLGGSFAMAAGIEGSGLSAWLAQELQAIGALPMLGQLFVAIGATVGLSAVASNTATINVMLNVLPRSLPLLFGSAMAASCDFALPAGTPPNAIVFGSGYISLRRMMTLGAFLDLAAVVLLAFYSYLYIARLFPG